MIGNNNILDKSTKAKKNTDIETYTEQLKLIISDEVADRKTSAKEELMIKSLYDKINPTTVEGVVRTYMCDEDKIEQENIEDNQYIIVETKEGYEFKIQVDNEKNIAQFVDSQPDDEIPNVTKTYLYNEGEINSQIGDILQIQYTSKYPQGKFSKSSNNFSIEKVIVNGNSSSTTTDPWSNLYVISQNKFDFNGYSKLCYSYSSLYLRTGTPAGGTTNYRSTINLGVCENKEANTTFDINQQLISPDKRDAALTGSDIVEIDISGYNKASYIKIMACTSSFQRQAANITIDKIWVE